MKANFIIGKKQIVVAALMVILGGAIYVNWAYANNNTLTLDAVNEAQNVTETKETANYGDAKLVNTQTQSDDEYFTQVSLERERSRDEAIETINNVLASVDSTSEEYADASAKILEISAQIESENKIENLIKAKGYSECVVYLSGESANVVVKTDGLDAQNAAQIKNIILSEQDIKAENISIVEVK